MFRQTYQSGLLSILSSQGSKPFQTWICKVSNGYIKRITDEDINSLVLELISNNVSSTYVTCPCCPYESLGIKMQYLNLYIKNLRRYFVMEIEVLDSKNMHRRFKISTFATKTKIGPFGTHSPLTWIEGWNRLTLNLESFTTTVYGTNYVECRRITIHANCRIRRVFFADREYKEEELPLDYQIRCHIDRAKHYVPKQRMFSSNKSTYKSKSDQNQLTKILPTPSNLSQVQNQLIDSTKKEIINQFTPIEEIPSNERIINAPQGSIASDVQKVEDLNDNDRNSDIEQIYNQQTIHDDEPPIQSDEQPIHNDEQPIIDTINNLNLDSDQKSFDDINFSSNAYRQRYFNIFHRQYFK
ncbi:unnamed protein product [Rotaria sp. Silwood1]|nr:unnamed protein product [Rotaria sp. Silwood1]CAF3532737.1 unnamed protein product [Rotaria sp. Silwood1]CAF3588658.1 unnamed protein product [Rotaria sp. Silwood1]CAF3686085.1 unnamed protein product [Rotaria sp. Silwood1]